MGLTEEALIVFLQEHRQLPDIGPDTVLFSDGTIDSVVMIELINFIEAKGGIEVGQADVTLENFDTVSLIVNFVRAKSGQ